MRPFGSAISLATLTLGVALLVKAVLVPATAALGGTAASVEADRVSLKGQLRARSQPGYSVQEITAATGTVIREYISPAGVVFAVSWSGPTMPNLQQTLGAYFTQYQAAVQSQRADRVHRSGHHRLEIRAPSLVVHAGGHMRQFFGIAYVPSLLPQNLSISDLH